MKQILFSFFLIIFSLPLFGQNKFYFVQFKDRKNTPFAVSRPQEFLSAKSIQRRTKQNLKIQEWELPVNPNYLAEINKLGKVQYTTRWFNGVFVETTDENLSKIRQLDFVKPDMINLLSAKPNDRFDELSDQKVQKFSSEKPENQTFSSNARSEENYGVSADQSQMVGIHRMHEKGFRGEGMLIAVLDNAFTRANTLAHFQHLKIVDSYNFAQKTTNVFGISRSPHGERVLSVISANKEGTLIGAAYKADVCLYQTEIDNSLDVRQEEFYWIVGAERADSVGVDVLSSSLSYADFVGFDYQKTQLDGNTAWITQAADKASAVGMIVVISASNDGNTAWQRLRFPADADSSLTVGAVDRAGKYLGFSSLGHRKDGKQKPDVAALGGFTVNLDALGGLAQSNGTSFAAPIIAGLAAGLWQAFPQATNMQIVEAIRRSGSHFYTPNDSVGYGIPSFEKAQFLVTNNQNSQLQNQISLFPNPVVSQNMVLVVPDSWKGEKIKIKLTDLTGKSLWNTEKTIQSVDNLIDFGDLHLARGIYLLQIQTPFFQKTEKLIWKN